MPRNAALQIAADAGSAPLSPAQKRFNTLVRQIEQARQVLSAWHEGTASYREAGEDEDAELKALFAKHAQTDFDTEQREVALAMKDLAEAMTGMDLGDDDGIANEADLFARMQQGARQQHEREQAALMQRVNQAYAANDLLAMLQLQLEIEQIDTEHMARASAERLKHYNKVLDEQLRELKSEIAQVEMAFYMEFNLQPDGGLSPRTLGQLLERTRRAWRAERAEQQRLMAMLADPARTKRWLQQQRRERNEQAFGFNPF